VPLPFAWREASMTPDVSIGGRLKKLQYAPGGGVAGSANARYRVLSPRIGLRHNSARRRRGIVFACDDAMIRRHRPRMTVATLKQHMDRRFDRLQRTKADKSDLARFATRDELKIQFAAINRQFDSLNAKIDSVLRIIRDQYRHHDDVLTEHDRRIADLERRPGAE
jgi:hypothetical protein